MSFLFLKNSRRGATLMEMLVYLAILTIFVLSMAEMTITISQTFRAVKVAKDVESAAVSAMERMTRDVRSATSINTASSTLSSSPGVLQLNESSAPTVVKFYTSSGSLLVDESGVYIGPLIPDDVSVTNLVFTQITTANTKAVKIELQLQSNFAGVTTTKNFYSTVGLRQSF